MNESYYVGTYWGGRPESAEQCARRAETFFRLLAASHPSYARWFEQHNSTKKALQLEFEPTFDAFMRFFTRKKNQAGRDGFSFAAWTGHVKQDQGGMVMLGCGGDAEATPNMVFLDFPSEPLGGERQITLPVLTEVMRAMVLAWEPDWAVASPWTFPEQMSSNSQPGMFVGWLTYYSRQWGEVPPLPAPVRVEPFEERGTLVVLTPERLSAHDPEHVALGHRVQAILDAKDLLRPVVY
jgi:hypothetical protein